MDAERQAVVERLLGPVLHSVQPWCDRYPILSRYRTKQAAAFMIIENPALPVSDIATQTAMAWWAVAFDDVLDRKLLTERDIVKLVKHCAAVSHGSTTRDGSEHELCDALRGFLNELGTLPHWEAVSPWWVDAFKRFLRGSLREYRWSMHVWAAEPRRFPTLRQYMRAAQYSIALPWLLLSLLAFSRDPSI
ncbi:MAG TPA: hypothetical protein VH593_11120, partial [Ktedonobacteraceae bacterium]